MFILKFVAPVVTRSLNRKNDVGVNRTGINEDFDATSCFHEIPINGPQSDHDQ